jgi:quercetin dioxygenase-like cupin family protein
MVRSSLVLIGLLLSLGCATAPRVPVRHVVGSAEAPTFRISQGKGTAVLLLNEATGARAASLGVLELETGAQVAEHVHESSVEMLYVEEGSAEMTVEGQPFTLKAGDGVYIPAGVRHSARVPEGTPRLRAVQVYVGPGPEQRFRQGTPVTLPSP